MLVPEPIFILGRGEYLELSEPVTVVAPPSAPSAPVGPLEVTSKTLNSITVHWNPPKETGGSPVSTTPMDYKFVSQSGNKY